MVLREQDKHFLWSLYSAVAVIFTWKGIWSAIYEIPYVGDPFIFLFIGFAILTFSGLIFNEFDPLGGLEKAVDKVTRMVRAHPQKKDFVLTYYDKYQKQEVYIPAMQIVKMEKDVLVTRHPQKAEEIFIPIHRIREIRFQGKRYWRL